MVIIVSARAAITIESIQTETAGEREVRYMSAGKRVCAARKSVSDS
jgi:hypothetical protein